MSKNHNYTDVLLEEMRDQMQAMFEIIAETHHTVGTLPTRTEFDEVKADVKTIKHVVTDTNKDLALLERRVDRLERAA